MLVYAVIIIFPGNNHGGAAAAKSGADAFPFRNIIAIIIIASLGIPEAGNRVAVPPYCLASIIAKAFVQGFITHFSWGL